MGSTQGSFAPKTPVSTVDPLRHLRVRSSVHRDPSGTDSPFVSFEVFDCPVSHPFDLERDQTTVHQHVGELTEETTP